MSPTKLYFSADGRIGTRTFWRAIILLLAVQVVERLVQTVLPVGVQAFYPVFAIIFTLALFVAYLSVYSKRLHDAGKGAGWFFLALLGALVCFAIVIISGIQTLVPEFMPAYQAFFDAAMEGRPSAAEEARFIEVIADNNFRMFGIELASLFITNFVIGWLVARLPSDPGVNRFGPPEQGGDPDVFN